MDSVTDKKGRVSLNHLLNFTFPERQAPPPTHGPRRRPVQHVPYNKERFLNANFRFIVSATGEYHVHLADPDCAFEWDTVEQVLLIASSEEEQACPICLSPPSAARVTKCGHVFCLPCILHYLALRENPKRQWRKCPICWDAIYERDIKPVKLLVSPWSARRIRTGDHLDMSLIYRTAGSILAFPVSDTWPLADSIIDAYLGRNTPLTPWQFTPNAMHFARFMLASPDYLETEFLRDRSELQDAIKDAKEWGSTDEIPFILEAVERVNVAIDRAKRQHIKKIDLAIHTSKTMFEVASSSNIKSSPTTNAESTAKEESSSTNEKHQETQADEVPMAYLVQQQHPIGNGHASDPKQPQRQQQKQNQSQASNTGPHAEYYFFQANDGQHVYLHPLDSRVMKHEYGDYSHFPLKIQVKVEGVEESSMTEDLRKRFKYLSHLPLACDVTFVEVDLKNLVSKTTLNVFANELKQRDKKRQERVRREERMRKAAEARQKKQTRRYEEENRRLMDNDPFFQINQPMRPEENDEMLARAIELSTQEQGNTSGPRTVWGTRAVPTQEEEQCAQNNEWADHIIVTTKKKKNKHRKK
ncbi:hypothetical protein K492DRAFT_129774 [Lichtheimia hyalospora FSU 10163]|nr:hypothetical protein K492DRAFT_129774 [Lichtheimia hyalospora FSU 10163]